MLHAVKFLIQYNITLWIPYIHKAGVQTSHFEFEIVLVRIGYVCEFKIHIGFVVCEFKIHINLGWYVNLKFT